MKQRFFILVAAIITAFNGLAQDRVDKTQSNFPINQKKFQKPYIGLKAAKQENGKVGRIQNLFILARGSPLITSTIFSSENIKIKDTYS